MADENTNVESNAAPTPSGEETVTTETAPAQKTLSPAASSALRDLMDREASARAQLAEVKRQEAQLQQQRAELEALRKPEEPKEPHQVLETELETVKRELREFREREQAYRQQTLVEEERARVRSAVESNEEFKAINAIGAYDAVFDKIMHHYNQTSEWISESEAASQVNAELVELAEKLAPLLQKGPAAPATHETPQEAYKTLSARMTSESSSQSNFADLSEADLNRKAAELLRFKT